MVIQEVVEAVVQDRAREAEALQRAHKARVIRRRAERPRSGPSRQASKRFTFLSFMTRRSSTASVS
jgi:hypothetical protein